MIFGKTHILQEMWGEGYSGSGYSGSGKSYGLKKDIEKFQSSLSDEYKNVEMTESILRETYNELYRKNQPPINSKLIQDKLNKNRKIHSERLEAVRLTHERDIQRMKIKIAEEKENTLRQAARLRERLVEKEIEQDKAISLERERIRNLMAEKRKEILDKKKQEAISKIQETKIQEIYEDSFSQKMLEIKNNFSKVLFT